MSGTLTFRPVDSARNGVTGKITSDGLDGAGATRPRRTSSLSELTVTGRNTAAVGLRREAQIATWLQFGFWTSPGGISVPGAVLRPVGGGLLAASAIPGGIGATAPAPEASPVETAFLPARDCARVATVASLPWAGRHPRHPPRVAFFFGAEAQIRHFDGCCTRETPGPGRVAPEK